MVSEWSDQELGTQIGMGKDEAAEAELARRMGPRIRLYGLRHLRDASAADDLVQQVLITTLEALREGRLREMTKLTSFVLGTCRMMVLDLRRNARRKEQLLEKYGPVLADPFVPPVPETDRAQLAQCVERLRERERAVVMMTFFEDESGAGVAQLLGVTEANVRVIRHRAIHQLRDCMGVAA